MNTTGRGGWTVTIDDSEWEKLRRNTSGAITSEVLSTALIDKSREAQSAKVYRQRLIALLATVRQLNDVEKTLHIERVILRAEREHLANSPEMVSSINAAITELDAAVVELSRVREHEKYREFSSGFSLAKNRVGGLPRDQARQFFMSHKTRLTNLDKGRLTESERQILGGRRDNIKAAERLYIHLQRQALDTEAKKAR